MAVTNYRVFTIRSHRFEKKLTYQEPFNTNWARREVITDNWLDIVWTCERNPKHWCLQEKSNQSSDRLSWIKSVSETTFCLFRGQNWPLLKFSSLPRTWINQTLDLFPRDPKSSKTFLPIHRFEDAGTRPTQTPADLFWQNMKI